MSIDALRDLIPAYGKDISLNLSSLANETVLNDQQKWGCFLASAHAIGVGPVVKLIEAHAATVLSPEAMNAAKAAAAIMGMNNIYYRSLHLMKNQEYTTLPAKLRMNVIDQQSRRRQAGLRAVVHRRVGHQRLRRLHGRSRRRTAQARHAERPDPGRPAHRRRGPRRQPDHRLGDGAARLIPVGSPYEKGADRFPRLFSWPPLPRGAQSASAASSTSSRIRSTTSFC